MEFTNECIFGGPGVLGHLINNTGDSLRDKLIMVE